METRPELNNKEGKELPVISKDASTPGPRSRSAAADRWHVGFHKAGRMLKLTKTLKEAEHVYAARSPPTREKVATCDTGGCTEGNETKEEAGDTVNPHRSQSRVSVADVVKLWRRAELWNDTEAMYHLGMMYAKGRGVAQDFRQSAAYFTRAAQRGHVKSQHELAVIFRLGRGVPKDSMRFL